MSKKRLPKIKKVTRNTGSGAYGFDNGSIAFGDPMELIGKRTQRAREYREKYHETKAILNAKRS